MSSTSAAPLPEGSAGGAKASGFLEIGGSAGGSGSGSEQRSISLLSPAPIRINNYSAENAVTAAINETVVHGLGPSVIGGGHLDS